MVHSPLSLLSILTFLIGSVEAAPLSSSSPSTLNTSSSTTSTPVKVPIRRRNGLQTGRERREWMKNQGKAMNRKYGRPQKVEKRSGGVGTVQMTDYLDSIWFGDVQIGTPPIAYGVILDTGSSDLIVATPNCIGCPPDTPGFSISQSSTATNTSEPFEITYGSGAASGYIVEDTVSIAGFTSEKQAFALCDAMDSIVNSSISGILGMGWPSIASSGTTPLVQNIAEQGHLAQQVFAFAFESHTFLVDGPTTAPGGELTIGGVDTSKYSGEISWNELSEEGFWEIPLGGMSVDGQDTGISTPKAIIDTGTTLIGLPQSVMQRLYALVPSSAPADLDGNGGYFSFPCEQEVTLSLTFGGITYTMPPSAFNAGTYDFDEYTCLASVFGLSSERYIIGDAFLTTVYSAFRLSAPPAVGFAILGSGGQPPINTTLTGPISNQNKDSSSSQPLQTPTRFFALFLASTFLALARCL